MSKSTVFVLFAVVCGSLLPAPNANAQAVDYDVVYVRQPRYGDTTGTIWPEVFHPARAEPGADLMLLHPDGSEEVLVDCTVCSVTDPYMSFDGETVYYALFHDLTQLNSQRDNLPDLGADIFSLHLPTRQIEQLTSGEFTPNTGAGNWDETNPLDPPSQYNRLGYGVLNLGPCPLPGGRIAFTSNRNAFTPPKNFTAPTLQLFVMDEDGGNVEAIAPMTIGSALHPTVLRDGRFTFSTYESQALRDERLWGIWSIYPDGRQWAPVASAFRWPQALHFMTQLSDGDLVIADYYNLNNNGFGALYRFPVDPPPGEPAFHSAFPADNPEILETNSDGDLLPFKMPFTPRGLYSISPFTHGTDMAAPAGAGGGRVGKFTHPSAAPGGDMVVVWTPGPANDLNRPTPMPYYDGGIYLYPGAGEIWDAAALVELKNDPAYNEAWPRAVVPYGDIHGVAEPTEIPWLPNEGTLHAELPIGTPYGLVGTSSFYHRESFPGVGYDDDFDGLDAFNTSSNYQNSNWKFQGSDAGKYDDSEIWAVRIVGMEPNTHRSYGPHAGRQYDSFANERLRILGEIPLRKFDGQGNPVLDPHGNPDTSFLAKIAADTPFTFQTLDQQGRMLNMAQTWHQVRPGEVRTDCGGCHAHSQAPLDFEDTAASEPGYELWDLTEETPLVGSDASGEPTIDIVSSSLVDVEFYRDIRPILQRSCVSCHNSAAADGNLVLDDLTLYGGLPGDYKRLADDRNANWGYPPVIANGLWRQTNASRYVRMFQSRRSLLIWKLFGERLDGWLNSDHPTESSPGNPATLPPGASPNAADLDFVGDIMPPPGTAPALSEDEKRLFARWIDLGAPINSGEETGDGDWGWFLDDLRPALTVQQPRRGLNAGSVDVLRLGMADANSGIDQASLSISADFTVEGRPAGNELADLAAIESPGVYVIPLSEPLAPMAEAHLFVAVADQQGNISRVSLGFATVEAGDTAIFSDDFETGDTSSWSQTTQ